jgi:hypothetical protein
VIFSNTSQRFKFLSLAVSKFEILHFSDIVAVIYSPCLFISHSFLVYIFSNWNIAWKQSLLRLLPCNGQGSKLFWTCLLWLWLVLLWTDFHSSRNFCLAWLSCRYFASSYRELLLIGIQCLFESSHLFLALSQTYVSQYSIIALPLWIRPVFLTIRGIVISLLDNIFIKLIIMEKTNLFPRCLWKGHDQIP